MGANVAMMLVVHFNLSTMERDGYTTPVDDLESCNFAEIGLKQCEEVTKKWTSGNRVVQFTWCPLVPEHQTPIGLVFEVESQTDSEWKAEVSKMDLEATPPQIKQFTITNKTTNEIVTYEAGSFSFGLDSDDESDCESKTDEPVTSP